jgi:hypothetical protein
MRGGRCYPRKTHGCGCQATAATPVASGQLGQVASSSGHLEGETCQNISTVLQSPLKTVRGQYQKQGHRLSRLVFMPSGCQKGHSLIGIAKRWSSCANHALGEGRRCIVRHQRFTLGVIDLWFNTFVLTLYAVPSTEASEPPDPPPRSHGQLGVRLDSSSPQTH